jgi:hypothetical protein
MQDMQFIQNGNELLLGHHDPGRTLSGFYHQLPFVQVNTYSSSTPPENDMQLPYHQESLQLRGPDKVVSEDPVKKEQY